MRIGIHQASPGFKKSYGDRDSSGKPGFKKSYGDRDSSGKPGFKKSYGDRDSSGRPSNKFKSKTSNFKKGNFKKR